MVRIGGRLMCTRRGISLIGVLYLVIGIIVTATHGYFVSWDAIRNIVEGLAAIVLWPLVAFFSVDLHQLIA